MLFQPAIIALLLASGVAVAMLAAAAPFAVQVIRQWDIASGSERQLQLERRTYLFSTLAVFVMAVQLVALLLFVFPALAGATPAARTRVVGDLGDAVGDVVDHVDAGDVLLLEQEHGLAFLFAEQRHQHVGAGDLSLA